MRRGVVERWYRYCSVTCDHNRVVMISGPNAVMHETKLTVVAASTGTHLRNLDNSGNARCVTWLTG